MGWKKYVDKASVAAPYVGAVAGGVGGFIVGGPVGAGVGAVAGYEAGQAFDEHRHPDSRPDIGSPPTEADAQKTEADKANQRRQRAAALLSQGVRANILTSPLGVPGGSTDPSFSQGRKTLLGS